MQKREKGRKKWTGAEGYLQKEKGEDKQKGRRRRRVKGGSSQLKERKSRRDNKEGFWHPGLIRPGALGQPQKPLR